MKKIIICGGHPTPAIAVIEKMRNIAQYTLLYIGKKYIDETKRKKTWEWQQIEKLHIKIRETYAGKLSRTFEFSTIIQILKVPIGFFVALIILIQEKPNLVVSFGGYIALPLVVWARLLRIPILLHEQTLTLGLANKISGSLSNTFCFSWRGPYEKSIHPNKVLTGNPLREGLFGKTGNVGISVNASNPVIYVTGGGLGSHFVNTAIEAILPELLQNNIVVHQTGNLTEFDDYIRLKKIRENLTSKLQNNYYLFEHIEVEGVAFLYKRAKLVIGRSGANTITELLAFEIPSILIPLPWAGENEQMVNAKKLESYGVAEVISQSLFSKENFFNAIKTVIEKHEAYKRNFMNAKKEYIRNGSENVLNEIVKLLQ